MLGWSNSSEWLQTRISRRTTLRAAGGSLLGGLAAWFSNGRAEDRGASSGASAQVPVAGQDPERRTYYLFVQNATSGSFRPNPAMPGLYTLVLEGVGARTIYFSDRPARDAGAVPMEGFLQGLGFSAENPPNAALVMADQDGDETTVVIELFSPRYEAQARRLTYDARILTRSDRAGLAVFMERHRDGRLPQLFGHASVFIDDCPDGGVFCNRIWMDRYVGCCWSSRFLGCTPCSGSWAQAEAMCAPDRLYPPEIDCPLQLFAG